MTTKITVDAHAGWPVSVIRYDMGTFRSEEIVKPHTTSDFFVWDGSVLHIEERPIPREPEMPLHPAVDP
jgi:hypothetical protein